MSFSDRLKIARERRNLKQPELARLCNWISDNAQGRISHYETGRRQPQKLEDVVALADALGVSLDWLVRGEGGLTSPEVRTSPVVQDFVLIPSYDVVASAGPGIVAAYDNQTGELAFKTEWLAQKGLNPSNLITCQADGDSMAPTITDGDLLLLDRSQRHKVKDGKIYVLRQDEDLRVKRITKTMTGAFRLGSDNPIWEDETVAPDDGVDLKIIGRVVWVGREVS